MKIISSYFGNRILRHVASDMGELARDGFTGVVHTFTENDLRFYKDSFKEIVWESHEKGLDVDMDPWGIGHVFGGEAFSVWIAENPRAMQISRNGEPKPLACLNNPDFRKFMYSWIEASKESGADGLFWDEPHLYIQRKSDKKSSWTCTCDICRKEFNEKFGKDFPLEINQDVVEFRNWTMVRFLADMLKYGKKVGMRNTVCLLPSEFANDDPLDWESVASLEGIDILSTDPYWLLAKKDAKEFVQAYSRKVKQLAAKYRIEPQIWILGFRIPAGHEDGVTVAVETAVREGIENLAIWGFEACRQMSSLKCENPELVWFNAIRAFKEVVNSKFSE